MNGKITALLFVVALVFIGGSMSLFIVDQRQQAIVLQFGKPIGDVKEAGLHLKMPFIHNVKYFDKRILSVDPRPSQVNIASSSTVIDEDGNDISDSTSGEPIILDTFVRYVINDPLQFMKSLKTVREANINIENLMNDSTTAVLGNVTLAELLSTRRSEIMEEITKSLNKKVNDDGFGIEIIDTRIIRADLTPELRGSTVRRMNSELEAQATETRAKGAERALEIVAKAERERTVIMANAERDSSLIRGHGDEQSIKIYADAYNKDKEFYSFSRTLEAYKSTLANSDTKLVVSPNSDFFKYFNDIDGKK